MAYRLHIEASLQFRHRENGTNHLQRMVSWVFDRNNRVHPCIKGELLLEVERVTNVNAARDITNLCLFVEDIFTLIKTNCSSEWLDHAKKDYTYGNAPFLKRYIEVYATRPSESRYVYFQFQRVGDMRYNIQDLRRCIAEGTPLLLPALPNHMHTNSEDVTVPEQFSYNRNVFPPYGQLNLNGHWYLTCYEGQKTRFVSFITNSQVEINEYLRDCHTVYLNYVPPCDH